MQELPVELVHGATVRSHLRPRWGDAGPALARDDPGVRRPVVEAAILRAVAADLALGRRSRKQHQDDKERGHGHSPQPRAGVKPR